MSTAIVFGANGVSGLAGVRELASQPSSAWKRIIAVSKSKPLVKHDDERIKFTQVDILDKAALQRALDEAGASAATHAFYYAYVEVGSEEETDDTNVELLRNAITACEKTAPKLQHFQVQTGDKYYGIHLGGDNMAPYPWKEDAKRLAGRNFQYDQEDLLKERAEKNGWHWNVTRPGGVIGYSKGHPMSTATLLGLYAAAKKHFEEPLTFPGTTLTWELDAAFSTASNNAAFQAYIATTEKAWDRAYNIHDGKMVQWKDIFPKIAEYFDIPLDNPPAGEPPAGIKAGSDIACLHSAAQWKAEHTEKLEQWAKDLGRDATVFDEEQWGFLDFLTCRSWKDDLDMSAAREIGWDKEVDIWEDGFKKVFAEMQKERVIPAPLVIEDTD